MSDRRTGRHRAGARVPLLNGKVIDLTGPGLTERFGVTCTDLGACVVAPNGKLVSVFGDTFSGRRVGQGDWRSPVVLIGTGDADHEIAYEKAGGPDPDYARQLWHYTHDDAASGWTRGGISTVIPSDLLRVGDSIYLHAIVNRGFGNVIWTEIWRSHDSGISWTHLGERAKFPADLHGGHAQCWSWDFDPDDGWVYVTATGFQRDKGIILMRVRPDQIGDRARYSAWGFTGRSWQWGKRATPITPAGERWGELSLRRMAPGKWILGGFLASKYALGYRVVDAPVANMHTTPLQTPIMGSSWAGENHNQNQVAQLYGGYVPPRFTVRHPGRYRPGGVAVAYRLRMALSGNAIQSPIEGYCRGATAIGPDQSVIKRCSRRRRSSSRRSRTRIPGRPGSSPPQRCHGCVRSGPAP